MLSAGDAGRRAGLWGIVRSAIVVLLPRKGSWRVADFGRPLSTG
jgi:hypothetical protein